MPFSRGELREHSDAKEGVDDLLKELLGKHWEKWFEEKDKREDGKVTVTRQ